MKACNIQVGSLNLNQVILAELRTLMGNTLNLPGIELNSDISDLLVSLPEVPNEDPNQRVIIYKAALNSCLKTMQTSLVAIKDEDVADVDGREVYEVKKSYPHKLLGREVTSEKLTFSHETYGFDYRFEERRYNFSTLFMGALFCNNPYRFEDYYGFRCFDYYSKDSYTRAEYQYLESSSWERRLGGRHYPSLASAISGIRDEQMKKKVRKSYDLRREEQAMQRNMRVGIFALRDLNRITELIRDSATEKGIA